MPGSEDYYNATLLANASHLVETIGSVSDDFERLEIVIENVSINSKVLNVFDQGTTLKANKLEQYYDIKSVQALSGETVITDFNQYHSTTQTFSVKIVLTINQDTINEDTTWLAHHTAHTGDKLHLDLYMGTDESAESSDLNVVVEVNAFDGTGSTRQDFTIDATGTAETSGYATMVRDHVLNTQNTVGKISILDGVDYSFNMTNSTLTEIALLAHDDKYLLKDFSPLWQEHITKNNVGGVVRNLKLEIISNVNSEVLYTIHSKITVRYSKHLPYAVFSNLGLEQKYDYTTLHSVNTDIIHKALGDEYKQAVKSSNNQIQSVVTFINNQSNGGLVELTAENSDISINIDTPKDAIEFVSGKTYSVNFSPGSSSNLRNFLTLVEGGLDGLSNVAVSDLVVVGDKTKLVVSGKEAKVVNTSAIVNNEVTFELSFGDSREFNDSNISVDGELELYDGSKRSINNSIPELSGNLADMEADMAYSLSENKQILTIHVKAYGKQEVNFQLSVRDNQFIEYKKTLSLTINNDRNVELNITNPNEKILTWRYDNYVTVGGYEMFNLREMFAACDVCANDLGEDNREGVYNSELFNSMVRIFKVEVTANNLNLELFDASGNTEGVRVEDVEFTYDLSGTGLTNDEFLRNLGLSGYFTVHYKTINSSAVMSDLETVNFMSPGTTGITGVVVFDEVIRVRPEFVDKETGLRVENINLGLLTAVDCHEVSPDACGNQAYQYKRESDEIQTQMIKLFKENYLYRNKDNSINVIDDVFIGQNRLLFDLNLPEYTASINIEEYNADSEGNKQHQTDYSFARVDIDDSVLLINSNKSIKDEKYGVLPFTINATQDYNIIPLLTVVVDSKPIGPERFYYETIDDYINRVTSNNETGNVFNISGSFNKVEDLSKNTSVQASDISGSNIINEVTISITVTDLVQEKSNNATATYVWEYFIGPTLKETEDGYWDNLIGQDNVEVDYWVNLPLERDFVEDISRNYDASASGVDIDGAKFIQNVGADGDVWRYQINYDSSLVELSGNTVTYKDTATVTVTYMTEHLGRQILNGDQGETGEETATVEKIVTYTINNEKSGMVVDELTYNGVKPHVTYSDDYEFSMINSYGNTTVKKWDGTYEDYAVKGVNPPYDVYTLSQVINRTATDFTAKFVYEKGEVTTAKDISVNGRLDTLQYASNDEVNAFFNANEIKFRDILATNKLSIKVDLSSSLLPNTLSKPLNLDAEHSELGNLVPYGLPAGAETKFTLTTDALAPKVTIKSQEGVEVDENVITLAMTDESGMYNLSDLFTVTDASGATHRGDLRKVVVSYVSGGYVYDAYKTGTGGDKLAQTTVDVSNVELILSSNVHTLTGFGTQIKKNVPGHYEFKIEVTDDHNNVNANKDRKYIVNVVDTTPVQYTLPEDIQTVVGVNYNGDNHLQKYIKEISSVGVLAELNNITIGWTTTPSSYELKYYYWGSKSVAGRVEHYPLPTDVASGTISTINATRENNTNFMSYKVPASYIFNFSVTMPTQPEDNGLYSYGTDVTGTMEVKIVDNTLPSLIVSSGGAEVPASENLSTESAAAVSFNIETNNAAEFDVSSNKYAIVTNIQKLIVSGSTTTVESVYTLADALISVEVRDGDKKTTKSIDVRDITTNHSEISQLKTIELLTYASKAGVSLNLEALDVVSNLKSEPSGFTYLVASGNATNNTRYIVTVVPLMTEGNYIAIGSARTIEIEMQAVKNNINAEVPEQKDTITISRDKYLAALADAAREATELAAAEQAAADAAAEQADAEKDVSGADVSLNAAEDAFVDASAALAGDSDNQELIDALAQAVLDLSNARQELVNATLDASLAKAAAEQATADAVTAQQEYNEAKAAAEKAPLVVEEPADPTTGFLPLNPTIGTSRFSLVFR
jgi:hypothetical protein